MKAALSIAVSALILGAAASSASAGDLISAQLGVASQYIGKGLGKSNDKPSVSGSIELSRNGFYGSLFAASAELPQGSDAEILTTIGYRRTVSGFGLDLSVINRDMPGTRSGIDANWTEYQADASHKFGPVSARLRVNYTADGFNGTKEAWWVELQGGVALNARTKATAAIEERTADGGAEYTAWNAGVKRGLTSDLSLDLRWYDTDGHRFGDAYDGRLVGALTYSF